MIKIVSEGEGRNAKFLLITQSVEDIRDYLLVCDCLLVGCLFRTMVSLLF